MLGCTQGDATRPLWEACSYVGQFMHCCSCQESREVLRKANNNL